MRRLALALLLLNLVLLAWQLGGTGQAAEREPGRLAQQVHPERVRVLPAAEAASAAGALAPGGAAAGEGGTAASAAAGTVTVASAICLEAGPFAPDELAAAEAALAALPAGSWQRLALQSEAAYLVYQGRFASERSAQRRLQELRRRGVAVELARDLPALEPGLVFSRHARADEAAAALAALQEADNGPRLARVVAPEESASVLLRVAQASDEVRARIAAMEPSPALRGGFRGCSKPS